MITETGGKTHVYHGRKSMTRIKGNSADISTLNTEVTGSCHGTNGIRTRTIFFYCLTLGRVTYKMTQCPGGHGGCTGVCVYARTE